MNNHQMKKNNSRMIKSNIYEKLTYLFLVVIVCSFYSCSSSTIAEEEEEDPTPITKKVTYDADVKPIISSSCTGCHGGATPKAGLDLTTYAKVKSTAEAGKLTARMNNSSNPMPPSGILSANKRQIIDKWVSDGFLEK